MDLASVRVVEPGGEGEVIRGDCSVCAAAREGGCGSPESGSGEKEEALQKLFLMSTAGELARDE